MPDFFISFNKNDRDWAAWIAWTLVDAKYTVIFQDWDFHPGHNFADQMDKALRTSDRLIAVLSQTYLDSAYARSEWLAAFTDDATGIAGKLVPVKVGACRPDGLLRPLIHIDLIGKTEKAARDELLKGLKPSGRPEKSPPFPGTSVPQKEPEPAQPEPVQPKPAQPKPAQPEPAQPEPAQPKPVQPEPAQPKPVQPQPAPAAQEPESAEPPPDLPARPRWFPGLRALLIRWAIAAVLLSLLFLAGRYISFFVQYRTQTTELRLLAAKTDRELSDTDNEKMKELAASLYEMQKKIGPQSDWPGTYRSLCGWPHVIAEIPPPEGTRCP